MFDKVKELFRVHGLEADLYWVYYSDGTWAEIVDGLRQDHGTWWVQNGRLTENSVTDGDDKPFSPPEFCQEAYEKYLSDLVMEP